jgi:hypothetical protein
MCGNGELQGCYSVEMQKCFFAEMHKCYSLTTAHLKNKKGWKRIE